MNRRTVKLSDVCKIKYGKDHKHFGDGKIPVYGSGGIMRYVDIELYSMKSVLIPRKGSLGKLLVAARRRSQLQGMKTQQGCTG